MADSSFDGPLYESPESKGTKCVVYGAIYDGFATHFVECWSGTYEECAMFVDSPQSKLDLEMGTFVCFQIYQAAVANAILGSIDDEESIH